MDEALIALLKKKDFEFITVKEICEKAGVNRSTFYLHYENLGDLLAETTEMINKRFQEGYKKTFIDVSRHGTKAAAVTWATMKCGSTAPMETYRVILDRPFVYAIVDNATGLPLFLGVVTAIH